MSEIAKVLLLLIFIISIPSIHHAQNYCNSDPVSIHGALSVNGTKIVDQDNNIVSFAGNSFFWSNTGWGGERYYNENVVAWLKEDWNTTIIRASMGVDENGGYLSFPANNKNRITNLVDAAIANNLYVIIDWHSHHAEDYQSEAISFFEEMAETYGNHPNVIYEIYNEPLQVSWTNTVKPYAEAVIEAIRAIDPDNLIIVGTPTWSQDVDVASNNPITGYDNIAYTLHFYAGTHTGSLRQKAQTAMNNGIALMVTEWGSVNADGDGGVANASTDAWMTFLADNDITHLNWAMNDKDEGSSALKPGSSISGGWSNNDLTESGIKSKNIIQNWSHYCSSNNMAPSISIDSPINNSVYNAGSTITISASAADDDGSISSVEFFVNGLSIGTADQSPYSIDWTPIVGSFNLTARVRDNENASTISSEVFVTIEGETAAYPNGDAHMIPGVINASRYDTGGPGVSYFDTDQGNNNDGDYREDENVDAGDGSVGWIDANEWLEFSVDVQNEGIYSISYDVATIFEGQFRVEFDGEDVTGPLIAPFTGGWGDFETNSIENVFLSAGSQKMRLYFTIGSFNIGDLHFEFNPDLTIAATGVNVNPSQLTLVEGETSMVTATVLPSDASNTAITWSSNDPNIASVSNDGEVLAISEGTTELIATTVDGGFTSSVMVTVNELIIAVTGVNINPFQLSLKEGESATVSALVFPSNANNTSVTWSSDDANIASINGAGEVLGINVGATQIRVTTVDGGFTSNITVTVIEPAISVTGVSLSPDELTLDVDESSVLVATVSPTDASNPAITWSSDDVNIAIVNGLGEVLGVSEGSTIVNATTVDGAFNATAIVNVSDIVSISNVDSFDGIEIYPNPVVNELVIVIHNAKKYEELSIYDAGSQLIYSQLISEDEIKISTSKLHSGVFILRLKGESESVSKVFIKE